MSHGRKVLHDVPRVGFYPEMKDVEPDRGPEDIIFPSCMRATMEYLGHPQFDYVHFVGVTGAGFYLNWKDGWHPDNSAIYYMAPFDEHVKLFAYAYESAGYRMDAAGIKSPPGLTEAETRTRITGSIDRGVPVLSHGIVGPPETSIITGYDEGGDVLVGWSFFQHMDEFIGGLEFEPNGMFRKRGWYPEAFDVFLVGEPLVQTDARQIRRRSLEWAVKVVRTSETWNGRTNNGLAAYDAWARHLLRDSDIDKRGSVPNGSGEVPYRVHTDAVGTVAEGRHYASEYLIRVAQAETKWRSHLLCAAGCYSREHDLMWEIWDCCGGNGYSDEHIARFADRSARLRIVALIGEAKEQDEEAIKHIEAVLASDG